MSDLGLGNIRVLQDPNFGKSRLRKSEEDDGHIDKECRRFKFDPPIHISNVLLTLLKYLDFLCVSCKV